MIYLATTDTSSDSGSDIELDMEVDMLGDLVLEAIHLINDEDQLDRESEDQLEGEGSEGLEEEASDEPEEEASDEPEDEASDEPEEEEDATITSFDDLLSAENYVRVNEFVTSKVNSLSLSLSFHSNILHGFR